MVDIEEWTGPGAKEWPNEHRPLQPGVNCVLVLMVMIFVMLMMLLVIMIMLFVVMVIKMFRYLMNKITMVSDDGDNDYFVDGACADGD